MKIIQLKAQNYKNLKAVELHLNGQGVTISGANGAGKTAILDAIVSALTGAKPDDPIRHGADKAEIMLKTEKWTVKKVFTKSSARLEILNSEGAAFKSPQALLDQVIGDLSFDPLHFANLKPKEQRELLVKVSGLDTTEIDAQRQELFEERTLVNREKENLRARFQATECPGHDVPENEVSVQEKMAKLGELEEQQAHYEKVASDLDGYARSIAANEQEIERIMEQAAALKERNKVLLETADKIQLPVSPVDKIAAIKKVIAEADTINSKVRAKKQYLALERELTIKVEQSDSLTASIELRDKDKAAMIQAAKMPVDGLTLGEDGVSMNGIPFSQLSTGQKIRISTAMAMALNPSLRVIFTRDASLLDAENLKALMEQAASNDYQLFIERVDDSGKVGVYIEEGEVKAVNAVAV